MTGPPPGTRPIRGLSCATGSAGREAWDGGEAGGSSIGFGASIALGASGDLRVAAGSAAGASEALDFAGALDLGAVLGSSPAFSTGKLSGAFAAAVFLAVAFFAAFFAGVFFAVAFFAADLRAGFAAFDSFSMGVMSNRSSVVFLLILKKCWDTRFSGGLRGVRRALRVCEDVHCVGMIVQGVMELENLACGIEV